MNKIRGSSLQYYAREQRTSTRTNRGLEEHMYAEGAPWQQKGLCIIRASTFCRAFPSICWGIVVIVTGVVKGPRVRAATIPYIAEAEEGAAWLYRKTRPAGSVHVKHITWGTFFFTLSSRGWRA